eukprot:GGOE01049501.1.p1 GENE.GGOE01049501.1~~GGOE01049501.1.p1  ORF type:complete len:422 (-),score=130.12 GGOE01049501.1:116-1345(-)
MDEADLSARLQELEVRLQQLCQQLEMLRTALRPRKVDGLERYCRAVATEQKFVQAMCDGRKEPTKSRVLSSNVSLFEALHAVLLRERGVVGIGQTFTLDGRPRALKVDVVSEFGSKWIKVKAMSGRTIEDLHEGRGRFGEKSVAEVAAEYLRCASQNIVNFGAPKVEFVFTDLGGIPGSIIQQLQSAGILVTSPTDSLTSNPVALDPAPASLEDDESDEEVSHYHFLLPPRPEGCSMAVDPSTVQLVNFDVTALIALSSELTHGGCVKDFPQHPVLQRQAEDERRRPVVAGLQEFLQGKEFVVCARAVEEFLAILEVVAGPEEKARGRALLARCRQVPDQPSKLAASLPESRRIKMRQKAIFGTGDALQAITLTANVSFVRAAQEQGVHFPVLTHPSRALTEMKGVWPT